MGRLPLTRIAVAFIAAATTLTAAAQPPRSGNAAEIRLELEKLAVVGSALFIAAHPDDENTAMLSWLASERKVRTAYLSLTRGDGGQNLIGDEIGPALGVIRTQELLAARRIDRAQQFFTRAVDFGYSKSAEETFANWPREEILGDVVWVIRSFRPDVIITRFPSTGEGGHGQHTASAILALEAWDAAADPERYPEQLAHVKTWRAQRVMWNEWRPDSEEQRLRVDLGEYNPLLGRSYTEIAGESRSQHKSQGFGSAERRGTLVNFLRLERGEPATDDLFDGIDLSWKRIPGAAHIDGMIGNILRSFDATSPSAVVPMLIELRSSIAEIDHPDARAKLPEVESLIRRASGLWLEAIAPSPTTTRGSTLNVDATAILRSEVPATLLAAIPLVSDGEMLRAQAAAAAPEPAELRYNERRTASLRTSVPAWAPLSEPYWLRDRAVDSRETVYPVVSHALLGQPVAPSPFAVRFEISFGDEVISFIEPVEYRTVDRVRGEIHELVRIVPALSVEFADPLLILAETQPRDTRVRIRNNEETGLRGSIRFRAPAGWRIEPSTADLDVSAGASEELSLRIHPPEITSSGLLSAELVREGRAAPARSIQRIDYEHIPPQLLMPEAAARLVRVPIERRGSRVGYIQGSGDEGARALAQIGYQVIELDDQQLARADLSRFDAIVVGVRAFNAREAARAAIPRLHEYVRAGGRVVVQYHTADRTLPQEFAPVPLRLGRGRVTVEQAPVRLILPDHPLLTSPNRITGRDFEGWVQERGLYFGESWDPAWQTPLAAADPGEAGLPGGLLYVRYGEGEFIYTGYSFFRQIPAGVPGALRLLANLVSAEGADER